MNEALAQLLPNLAKTTPAQLAKLLAPIGLHLVEDDWSGLLYGIEEVAQNGRADLAEQLMSVCLRVAQENENAWAVRAVTYFLGRVYFLQGHAERAIAAYQTVHHSAGEALDKDGRIQASIALSSLARVQMAQGHMAEAILTIQRAIDMSVALGREVDVVGDQLTLAALYLIQEDFAKSKALLQTTLARAEQLGHPELIALALMRLASLQEDLNQPATAIPYYESALAVLEGVEEPDDEEIFYMTYRETLVGLGMAYEALGQSAAAMDYYAEASRLTHWWGDDRQQAVVLTWFGMAQLASGQPRLAVRSFKAAERLAQRSGHTWWLGTNSFFSASAWQALADWEKAETAVERARQYHAATPGEHSADEAGCLVELGEIAIIQNKFEVAVTHYQQALTVLENIEIGQMHRLIYLRLGEAYWYQGQFVQAHKKLRQALNVYESKRQTVSELWARVDFAPSRDDVYAYLVRTCLALGKVIEAFTAVEEGRMRVYREQLAAQPLSNERDEPLCWLDIKLFLRLDSP